MKNKNLSGRFSPSRLKTLDCLWKYDLQYNQKIYPLIDVKNKYAYLGSLFHYFAEHWETYRLTDSFKDRKEALIALGKTQYPLEPDQEAKFKKMVDIFINTLLPIFLDPYPGDTVIKHVNEIKIEGNINVRGFIEGKETEQVYSIPVNSAIDRLIELKSGKTIIIDYKTGSGSPSISSHLFQMLFYAYCYSQQKRKSYKNLEVWIVFPDAPGKKQIYKLTGQEIEEHMPEFINEFLSRMNTINEGPYGEDRADVGPACRFCKYKATELCLPSQMMFGAQEPENKLIKFKTGWPPHEKVVDPIKDILRR